MAQAAEGAQLWADCIAARRLEYTDAAAARIDEFQTADPADFLPTPPEALPAEQLEQLEAAPDLGGAPRPWVRVDRRARMLRPEGRLVVPREEWERLNLNEHWAVKFVKSLLPWVVVPGR